MSEKIPVAFGEERDRDTVVQVETSSEKFTTHDEGQILNLTASESQIAEAKEARKKHNQTALQKVRAELGMTATSSQLLEGVAGKERVLDSASLGTLAEMPEEFFVQNPEARETLVQLAKQHPEIGSVIVNKLVEKNWEKDPHPGGRFVWNQRQGSDFKIVSLPGFDAEDFETIRERTDLYKTVAQALKVNQEDVTDGIVASFLVAHEAGHAKKSFRMTFEEAREEQRERERKLDSLKYRSKRFPARYHESARQAYREFPDEKSADEFAVDFLERNAPSLFKEDLAVLQEKYRMERNPIQKLRKLFRGQ
ncbi:MAG: hypothetical protein UX89_C0002G0056 [Parcubacteria group bacterium GW2011_GWA2_47_16]|nr:MAG: hypothetical protein UX89_C0002G0056 [Parcubacteria group bacterium GW2011_GWA2_47_16]